MQLSIKHFCFVLAVVVANVKGDVVAFSGSHCDGNEGKNVACDDSCIDFRDRHSFAVLATGTHCVTAFENTGCSVPVGTIENSGGGSCSNVNTGTNVQSFRCSPNSVCDTIVPGKNITIAEAPAPVASTKAN